MIGPVSPTWLLRAEAEGVKLESHPQAQQLMVYTSDHRASALLNVVENPEAFEPHIQWFPWASNRDIYNGFLKALEYLTAIKNVIILTSFHKFYDAWARRGYIRKVGHLVTGNIHIYEAVKHA